MSVFKRLNITAEGQTEEKFVKQTLSEYLGQFNVSTDVRCVLTSKDKTKAYRGGLISYEKAKNDIISWLKEDRDSNVRFSTMFDLYALPNDFPSFEEAKKYAADPYTRVQVLENAFREDIGDYRFFPYIQLHEFEALILSKPQELQNEYFEYEDEIRELVELLEEIQNPELINDKPETAPSKRIIKLIPEYEYNKVSVGATLVAGIGIEWLIEHCAHFRDWLEILKQC